VFDLVRWSFVIALTPLALSLAWRLILPVANSIALGLARPSVNDGPGGSPRAVRSPVQVVSNLGVRPDPMHKGMDDHRLWGSLGGLRGC
jgi:hypothetical protein